MTFFESLIALGAVAIVLLQVARRLHLPYPAMLAAAGVAVAAIPGTPSVPIAPETALALFIAPILIDAGYDFPLAAARKLLVPLLVYAVVAVLVTATAVAAVSWTMLGLPLAAAFALGAVVAPPDAAAATAVVGSVPVSRRVDAVLKGESLFNDATTLILFDAALTIHGRGGLDGETALVLAGAAPGGILLGIGYGLVARKLNPFVDNTIGGTLLQFLHAFAAWTIASHLHLSAVLATVASAMTLAATATIRDSPRMRVHSYAVWSTVVFLLNVLAFLLMGMQARTILAGMRPEAFVDAAWFAAAVVGVVIAARFLVTFGYHGFVVGRFRRGGPEPISFGETLLVGWTGMRGLVTLATAFALPADFPQRGPVVLAAFAVVLVTLVVQGGTLAPLIRLLGANREEDARRERDKARALLAEAALERLAGESGAEAEWLRHAYRELRDATFPPVDTHRVDHRHGLEIAAILAQRSRLEELRAHHRVGPDLYLQLQEDLDWKQLAVLGDEDRRIEEG